MLNSNQDQSKQHQELLKRLCYLAMEWRGQPENRPSIVDEYSRVYEELRLLNWDKEIDIDCQLPEEYMPKDYLARRPFVPSKNPWPLSWRHSREEIERIMENEKISKDPKA